MRLPCEPIATQQKIFFDDISQIPAQGTDKSFITFFEKDTIEFILSCKFCYDY